MFLKGRMVILMDQYFININLAIMNCSTEVYNAAFLLGIVSLRLLNFKLKIKNKFLLP